MSGEPEMVERVARAICVLGDSCCLNTLGACHEAENARAAILAMREPTRPMVDSGVAFALCVTLGGDYRWSDYVADKHRGMIDAALAPTLHTEGDEGRASWAGK